MVRYLLCFFVFSLLFAENTFSLHKYGSAFVEKGTLTIVRKGKAIKYRKNRKRAISVFKNDLLRVGMHSYVKLTTVQRATVFMGSNAVFQIRPWRQGREKGYLRMLFGKAFFNVTGSKRRNFSLKTAMTVISVKGTKWEQAIASNGITDTYVRKGAVVVTPSLGPPTTIRRNQRSIVISQNRASVPITVRSKRKTKRSKSRNRKKGTIAVTLRSPAATSAKSSSLESEAVYIGAKKINRAELRQAKLESIGINERLNYANSYGAKSFNKWRKPANNKSFEKDLAESENMASTLVVNNSVVDTTAMNILTDEGFVSGVNLNDILDIIDNQVESSIQRGTKKEFNMTQNQEKMMKVTVNIEK
jgi:hypothetical protein